MNKIKYQILLLIIVSFLFSCATNNSKDSGGDCYFDKQIGFSICLPETWQVPETWQELENLKYKALIVTLEDNYKPMVMFVEEKSTNEFNDYVDANIKNLKKQFDGIQIQQSDFITAKNLKGKKLLTTLSQNGRTIRIIHYLFPGNNGYHLGISCGVGAEAGDKYDKLFDRTLKTFEWPN